MRDVIPPGTTLSRYRIDSKIGGGGMGEVYKATDTLLKRPVAIKVLRPDLISSGDALRRFGDEARAASALNHPHIIHIYEIGEATVPADDGSTQGVHYIAMEFVERMTLREKLGQSNDIKTLLEVLAQVADALAKAHAAGIVHRDLKPENIIVSEDGYAKVVDFGLAKLTDDRHFDTPERSTMRLEERTREGVIVGTAGYMSPEQVQGKAVDHRSDIFSFGCVLYEAFGGQKPFRGDSAFDTLHKILHEEPVAIRKINPSLPPELERCVTRCLAKNADERYQSIQDVGIELRAIRSEIDSSRSLSPTVISEVAQRPLSRLGTITVLVCVVVIAAAAIKFFPRTPSPRPSAVEPPPKPVTIAKLTSSGNAREGVISPDGKYLAYMDEGLRGYAGRQTIWLKHMENMSPLFMARSGGTW